MISQLHQEDKVWAMQQIVRLASEFAECFFCGEIFIRELCGWRQRGR
jgi:hypothetical protein